MATSNRIDWEAKYNDLLETVTNIQNEETDHVNNLKAEISDLKLKVAQANVTYLTEAKVVSLIKEMISSGEIDVNDKITDPNVSSKLASILNAENNSN